jgi:hypothetical protein
MNRHEQVLNDFIEYCRDHSELRFWQALRAWSGYHTILVEESHVSDWPLDTYSWEGRRHDDNLLPSRFASLPPDNRDGV